MGNTSGVYHATAKLQLLADKDAPLPRCIELLIRDLPPSRLTTATAVITMTPGDQCDLIFEVNVTDAAIRLSIPPY